MTDEHVRRAVRGDADALTQLLREVAPSVEGGLRIAASWRSMLEPTDVMQVTYLEAYMRIDSSSAESVASFEAWLRRIAQNNLQDAIRGLQRKKRPQPRNRVTSPPDEDSVAEWYELLGVTTTTPSRHVARSELLHHLSSALDALPSDYAMAIRLYDFAGLPIGDVAAEMGRSRGAVHMLRSRALDRLREVLGPVVDSLSRLP